ncbi:MFS transporter [Kribbella sp. NPDC051586]|uniref:MFS transporter n=1 Tax=Kribbella sp. NPDC051586 TaxID=3364118 RepID=UPI0037AB6FC6
MTAPDHHLAVDVPPAGRSGIALLVIAVAQLMIVLDGTIVTVALPSIQNGLHLAGPDLNWILTVYALAFGGLLLAGGRAADLFGRRRMFRLGLIVFAAASLLGGLATTGAVLIVARALQGLSAAIIAPTALSLLAATFPAGPRRTKALGVYGAMGALGSVVGLLVGGALTEYLNWRWILFVNIPIALIPLAGSGVFSPGGARRSGVDLPGPLTATLGFGALVLAVNQADQEGWTAPIVLGSAIAAFVLLTAFALLQRFGTDPMVPPAILANRGRAGANIVMLLMGAGMLATFYFLTLYMQVVKDYSPMLTGVAYLPFAAGMGIGAGSVGPALLAKSSVRVVSASGMVVAAMGMVWFAMLSPHQNPFAVLLPAQLVAGAGLGMVMVAITIAGVQDVQPRDTGVAAGLINTSQQIGGAIGLAVLASVATQITEGRAAGTTPPAALTSGYTASLLVGGGLYLLGGLVAVVTFARTDEPRTGGPDDVSQPTLSRDVDAR